MCLLQSPCGPPVGCAPIWLDTRVPAETPACRWGPLCDTLTPSHPAPVCTSLVMRAHSFSGGRDARKRLYRLCPNFLTCHFYPLALTLGSIHCVYFHFPREPFRDLQPALRCPTLQPGWTPPVPPSVPVMIRFQMSLTSSVTVL